MVRHLLAYTLTFFVSFSAFSQWTLETLSQARRDVGGTAVGSKVLFGGGYSGSLSARVDIYDYLTGQWSTAQLSAARSNMMRAVTSNGNKAYFGPGGGGGTTVDIYDCITNAWTVSNVSQERSEVSAASLGDYVFFAGGITASQTLSNVVDIFNVATGQWTTASLSLPRHDMAAAAAGTKVVFAGGYVNSVAGTASNRVDIYDIQTQTWTTASLSAARSRMTAVALGDKIFIAGGDAGSGSARATVDIYDASTNTWTTAALSAARYALSAASAGTKAVFAGGFGAAQSSVVDIYDSQTGNWTTGTLPATRSGTATASVGGKLFFAGGFDSNGFSSRVDIYTVCTPPVLTVTPDPYICPGGSATLTASGASTYLWSPATTLSAPTGATVTATPAGKTVYSVVGRDASACAATAFTTVNMGFTASASVSEICPGSETTLTANGVAPYNWSPADGLSATTGETITASPTETTTYSVTDGCANTTSVQVLVKSLPVVAISGDTEICSGSSTTLTASGAVQYDWAPGTGLSGTSAAAVTASPTQTTTYTVTGTGANDCSSTATVVVTVNPIPVLVLSPGTSICQGESTQLTATGAAIYSWSPATGLSAATGGTVTASPTESTTYSVTGTLNGCSKTGSVLLTVKTVAKPSIDVKEQNGEEWVLESSATSGNQWYLNGTLIAEATERTIDAVTNGTYSVQVGEGGCLSPFSDGLSVIITGTEVSNIRQIELYPNPANQVLMIMKHDFRSEEPVDAQVLDLFGRTVLRIQAYADREIAINVRHLAEGHYFLRARQGSTVAMKRFLKTTD